MLDLKEQIENKLEPDIVLLEHNRKKLKETQDELNAEYNDLKWFLKRHIYELASKANEREKKYIAWYVYWNIPELGPTTILHACFGSNRPHSAKKLINQMYMPYKCDECGRTWGEPLEPTNSYRVPYFKWKKGKSGSPFKYRSVSDLCSVCEGIKEAQYYRKRDEKREKELREIEDRLKQLKSMPYNEYLQTPEWDKRRKRAYWKADYKCQLCGVKDNGLNTHHNSKEAYKRRGEELDSDLIVLCNTCNTNFHDGGKRLGVQ